MIVNKVPNSFIEKIFWIQNQTQFNHWNESYSGWQHQVMGEYYSSLNSFLDILVEGVVANFGNDAISVDSLEMFIVQGDMDNLTVLNEINKLMNEFRKSFESESGIVKVLDDILELNNSTIYKLRLK